MKDNDDDDDRRIFIKKTFENLVLSVVVLYSANDGLWRHRSDLFYDLIICALCE